MDDIRQIGETYLDALSEAQKARHRLKNSHGNFVEYDKAQFDEATIDLALATKGLLSLPR